MAYFFRVVFAVVLWCLSPLAHAYPATGVAGFEYGNNNGEWYSSCGAAVSSLLTILNQGGSSTFIWASTGCSGETWMATRTFRPDPSDGPTPPYLQLLQKRSATVFSCPGGGTLSGQSCSCPAPLIDNGANNACVEPLKPTLTPCEAVSEGLNKAGLELDYTGAPRASTCYGGFVIKSSGTLCAGTKCLMFGPFQCGGGACTGNAGGGLTGDLADNPAPSKCPVGKINGEVNGLPVCLNPTTGNTYQTAASSGTQTSVSTPAGPNGFYSPTGLSCAETFPGSGSAQTIGIPSYPCYPNPPNGAPTTTTSGTNSSKGAPTTSTCDAFTCTVTSQITSTSAAGVTTTVKVSDSSSKDDFCAKYAKSALCATSTYNGGTCDAEPSCGGDVVQCAQALNSWKTYCAIKKLDGTTGYGNSASSGNGLAPDDSPIKNKSTKSVGTFDTTNPFSNTCPSDYIISTGSSIGSITLPLSQGCGTFQLMGNLLVGLALLGCAMFVVKGS